MKTAVYVEDGNGVASTHALALLNTLAQYMAEKYYAEFLENVFIHVHQLTPTLFRAKLSRIVGDYRGFDRDDVAEFKSAIATCTGFTAKQAVRHKIRCSKCGCVDVLVEKTPDKIAKIREAEEIRFEP